MQFMIDKNVLFSNKIISPSCKHESEKALFSFLQRRHVDMSFLAFISLLFHNCNLNLSLHSCLTTCILAPVFL